MILQDDFGHMFGGKKYEMKNFISKSHTTCTALFKLFICINVQSTDNILEVTLNITYLLKKVHNVARNVINLENLECLENLKNLGDFVYL